MKAYGVFIGLWILINFINISEGSPPSEKRILNGGDNMTLTCSTVRDPDMIYWVRRSNIITPKGTKFIAKAGKSFLNGKIEEFRDDSRISVIFENDSTEDGSVNYTLYISNISRQDSANYACVSTTDSTTEYISLYEIHVVVCNCFIDTIVHCDILSFNTPFEGSVNIIFRGSTVNVSLIENRFKFSHDHLNTLAQEQYIFVSLEYDNFRSNIQCILLQQSYPLSTRKTTTIPISSRRPTSEEGTKMMTNRNKKNPPMDKLTDTFTTTYMYTKSPVNTEYGTLLPTIHTSFSQTTRPTFSGHSSLENSTSMTTLPSKANGTSPTAYTTTQKQMNLTIESTSSERPDHSPTESMTLPSLTASQPSSTGQSVILTTKVQQRSTYSLKSETTTAVSSSQKTENMPSLITSFINSTTTSTMSSKSNSIIIISLSLGISAGGVFIAVVVTKILRRYHKTNNAHRGKPKDRRLQTLSRTISDFTFHQPHTMRVRTLNDEESDCGTSPMDLSMESVVSTVTTNLLGVRRPRMTNASAGGSTGDIVQTTIGIPMKELKNSLGQDDSDTHHYFVRENESTQYSPDGNPYRPTPSCSKQPRLEVATFEPRRNRCEAPDDAMFVNNILYETSGGMPLTVAGNSGQVAETNLYHVLEDPSLQTQTDGNFSAAPPSAFVQAGDSDAGPSGHQYEDIDATRKFVVCSGDQWDPLNFVMPNRLATDRNATGVQSSGCGMGNSSDCGRDVFHVSSASTACVSSADAYPIYAEID